MRKSTSVLTRRAVLATSAVLAAPALIGRAHAEASTVRLSHGFAIHYLQMMIIQDRKLLEKHAERMGLGKLNVEWKIIDGGNVINDAMLAGALDIASLGAPGFITLWSKALNSPKSAVIGVAGLGKGAVWLNTNKPNIKSLRDFGPNDKIAVPGIKTSFAAVVLEMAAAKEFGMENFAKLDPLTVGLPHPEAMAALVSGKTEITGHVASPPFNIREATYPNIHKVFSTRDILGAITIDVVYAAKRFADANPKIMEAFLAAMDEASQSVEADRGAAADSYIRTCGIAIKKEDVMELLNDPENSFATDPEGVMQYAKFLGQIGTIKTVPEKWSDMFIPQMANRHGS